MVILTKTVKSWNYSPSGITHPYNYQNHPEYWDTLTIHSNLLYLVLRRELPQICKSDVCDLAKRNSPINVDLSYKQIQIFQIVLEG